MEFKSFIVIFVIITVADGESLLGPLFRLGRQSINELLKPRNSQRSFNENLKNNKIQKQFSENENFFCDTRNGRSKVVPTSVHKLRPGDIDVIGAIGDSLTAANGIFAHDELQVILEGRGASWSIGGQKSWRNYLTLANILKEYNPKLYGYPSEEYASSFERASKFNVAEPGAMAVDTIHQARNLVKRMRSDKNVNMKNDWKMVTYMIGGNDFCLNVCYYDNQNEIVDKAGKDLIAVLRILRENMPRTLVNVVLPPDVSILTRIINRPDECKTLHYFECPCMFSFTHSRNRERTLATLKRWKQRVEEVVKMPEFHDRNDFEVTIHRFLDKADIPRFSNGATDLSYLSKDCFHFSQKGHALAANALWNSIMTEESQRLRYVKREFEEFKCPTPQKPFLITSKNS